MPNPPDLFLIIGTAFLLGCTKYEKDPLDYYPRVSTVSAVVQPDGSVLLTGRIDHEGSWPIEHAGFCMDTVNSPHMLTNQIEAEVQGDHFTAVYSGFAAYGTYYFRAWAANGGGYGVGNTLSLDSIEATVAAACTPDLNTLDFDLGAGPATVTLVQPPEEGISFNYNVDVFTSQYGVTFTFHGLPQTGTYITSTFSEPPAGHVTCSFFIGGAYALHAGSEVYVDQLTPDSWEITVCDAPWSPGFGTSYMTARFLCPN